MSELVFSYAENKQGIMVHVDDVPQGLNCGCVCPYCKEKLLARHGEIRTHGFAHHSDTRGANLKICYMVIVYKLAEQIIQTHKRLHLPSYYGIFRESDIEFDNVRIDSNFEREDKQPDVIATTIDGQQILIEFTFKYKVQRKNAEDYKDLTCLEIDLSDIKLEEVEDFLLHSNRNRRWLNNQMFFNSIESTYLNVNKRVKLRSKDECKICSIRDMCCAIKYKDSNMLIEIENSGQSYKICKSEDYDRTIKFRRNQIAEQERYKREQEEAYAREQELLRQRRIKREQVRAKITESINNGDRTCFMCKSNLDWMCRDHTIAHCGPYMSMGVPKNTPPDTAQHCRGFRAKIE